jgi:FlaA1/EpsC-like NDP-sugar epimerase
MVKRSVLLVHTLRVVIDVGLLALSLAVAFALRFDWSIPEDMLARMIAVTPYVVGLQYAGLAIFQAPRVSWRFFSFRDTRPFVLAFATSGAALVVLRYSLPRLISDSVTASHLIVPFSVVMLDTGLAFALTIGARALRRAAVEGAETHALSIRATPQRRSARTLLIGAGAGGVSTAQELRRRPDLGIVPVGFLDDNIAKVGTTIVGIPVLGLTSQLKAIAARIQAESVLITIANARGPAIRTLTRLCEGAGLPVRIVPGIHEIVDGSVNLSSIRDVAIEDLLGRAPIRLDESELSAALKGSLVMVTGAGGSIGSELCRQVARFQPKKLFLVDSSENNLFLIHRELTDRLRGVELVPLVASVTDIARMRTIFADHLPEVIFHAAAYKHVPMMELNPTQAIINNSMGTRIVADLADEFHSREFVLVSTDKAVRPSSIMGASKRAAEIYVQALGAKSSTRFITVRFGNVLGSAGSVIPIFKEQIARGGPVTITDSRMTRYFMTIPEACQLIMQAARLGHGGEIFMLDMGEPVKIVDLARDLISLSGFTPEVDIEIAVTGIRPGEKLTEELWSANEGIEATRHPSIFVGNSPPRSLEQVAVWFDRLALLRERATAEWVRPAFRDLIPEVDFSTVPAHTEPPPTELVGNAGKSPTLAMG